MTNSNEPDPVDPRDDAALRFQERIGHRFRDPALLIRALTHPSSTADDDRDNERMEFLGDAVLSLCVGSILYEWYPRWNEGQLTQVKSVVVSTASLAQIGEALGLREASRLGKGLPAHHPLPASVYANLFEAVCAAIFLDGGLVETQAFVGRVLGRELRLVATNGSGPNHKSALQQSAQRNAGLTPNYRVISSSGPDHGKIFEVVAVVGARSFPAGLGRSKKEAEQAAARRALEVLAAEGAMMPANAVPEIEEPVVALTELTSDAPAETAAEGLPLDAPSE